MNRFVGLISKPSKRLKEPSPHRFDSVPDNVHPDGESCRDQVFPRGPVLGMFWELRAWVRLCLLDYDTPLVSGG